MSDSEDESRTTAVGRKRSRPADIDDYAATAAGSDAKHQRLEETLSPEPTTRRPSIASSKESGEISESASETEQRRRPSESSNGSIFERWTRRNVSIPLSGVARKPSVPASKEANPLPYFEDDEASKEDEDDSGSETDSSSSSDDSSDESDYESRSAKGAIMPTPPTRELRVKDLSERDQDLQYKYFWLDVKDEDLVICMCCGGRGHMYENCMERICKHCNAYEEHASIACPTFRKCTHCRQRGHDAPDCKNRRNELLDDTCDICGVAEHLEVECLLGFKPEKPEQPEEEPEESPPPARSWMMSMLDDSRD